MSKKVDCWSAIAAVGKSLLLVLFLGQGFRRIPGFGTSSVDVRLSNRRINTNWAAGREEDPKLRERAAFYIELVQYKHFWYK